MVKKAKTIKLVNALERHKKHPETFEIPSKEELDNLKEGDFVKVIYEFTEEDECIIEGERFWVEVDTIKGEQLKGKVSNDLVGSYKSNNLKCDDRVSFGYENIINICKSEDL